MLQVIRQSAVKTHTDDQHTITANITADLPRT